MKGFFLGGGDVIEQIYLTKAGSSCLDAPPPLFPLKIQCISGEWFEEGHCKKKTPKLHAKRN